MNPAALLIHNDAKRFALDYGYQPSDSGLRAPPGNFECEPWYIVYFYESMMNGDSGAPFYSGDTLEGEAFELTDDEREAFDIPADHTYALLTYSELGFVGIRTITGQECARLIAEYSADDEVQS